MIDWIDVKDRLPEYNSWVLVTYYLEKQGHWCTRIFNWNDSGRSTIRKITHWSEINPPKEAE